MNLELQKKVADTIFYCSHGDPIKDFITDNELLEAMEYMFNELYGKDYLKTLLDDGEWERFEEH